MRKRRLHRLGVGDQLALPALGERLALLLLEGAVLAVELLARRSGRVSFSTTPTLREASLTWTTVSW